MPVFSYSLTVVPLDGDAASSCARDLQAAELAVAESRKLDELLAQKGEPPLQFGLALHVGEVEYGNIGTRQRLDFTVIGPAVNMASRLESLTKDLGVSAPWPRRNSQGPPAGPCRRSAGTPCAASPRPSRLRPALVSHRRTCARGVGAADPIAAGCAGELGQGGAGCRRGRRAPARSRRSSPCACIEPAASARGRRTARVRSSSAMRLRSAGGHRPDRGGARCRPCE